MRKIIDRIRNSNSAYELSKDLADTAGYYASHVIYVKTPDGAIVHGYDLEEETLSDGSLVYNIILQAT